MVVIILGDIEITLKEYGERVVNQCEFCRRRKSETSEKNGIEINENCHNLSASSAFIYLIECYLCVRVCMYVAGVCLFWNGEKKIG